MSETTRQVIIVAVICAALGLSLGVIIGYFSRTFTEEGYEVDESLQQKFRDRISATNIEENLKLLAEQPHIAGRDRDEVVLAGHIATKWKEWGLEVVTHPYKVLLSYPDDEDPNYVAIKEANGDETDKSKPVEKILDQSQNKSGVVNPFNAYSAAGNVTGELVYVNYARIDDFHYLERNQSINVTGKICISRYGKIFRGNKAAHAEQMGCTALIIYSDPKDYTVLGEPVYPDTWYLPGTGAQRGNLHNLKGDPLTFQYPSIKTAWRDTVNNTKLPRIPVTPIGYADAVKYLGKLSGKEVPDDWKGGLNITYKFGPGFTGGMSSQMFVHVTTKNQEVITKNVIGYIKGSVEPDRYVILGNHRDAWVFGAIDPSSGTAVMLEVSRVFGEAYKEGWRPRRTIVFCSWGAEEYGIIGSTEWVEEFQKVLSYRTTVYLNLDSAVTGNWSMGIRSMPNLNRVLFEAEKVTPHPYEVGKSLYEVSVERDPDNNDKTKPRVTNIGSGSDFMSFVQVTGVSSSSISYSIKADLGLASYPVYHSVYETFDLMKQQVDKDFKYHQTTGRFWAEVARRAADYAVLPLDCVDYADKLIELKNDFFRVFEDKMKQNGIDINWLNDAVMDFKEVAEEFHKRAESVDINDALSLRSVNDQLMQLDRSFIDINGLEETPRFRHVIFAPSQHNSYAGAAFPALTDSLFDIDQNNTPERWNQVRRQYSILVYHIGSAASSLREMVPMSGVSDLNPITEL